MIFVASYFTNADPSLYLAASREGEEFTALNGSEPILRGTIGTGQLRDPFIGVGPAGAFHLLATDGWASRCVVHAVSEDLTSWSPQTLVPVMEGIPGAHNAWAPEFFFDESESLYHVIWSSVVDTNGDTEPPDWFVSQDHRIWHSTTRDFVSFSPSEIFFDPGYSVIDATVLTDRGQYLMAFKDERGTNELGTSHKCIRLTSFRSPRGPFTAPTGPVSPSPVEGPALFHRAGRLVMIFDHYLEGRYGAADSVDGAKWSETVVVVPTGVRHASVLSVSESKRLPIFDMIVEGTRR